MTVAELPAGSPAPLIDGYDSLLVDLDGVVHLGDQPIKPAVAAIEQVQRDGGRVVFVTNNASREPTDVVSALAGFGVAATVDAVVTSAAVATRLLAARLPAGAPVLVVGSDGLRALVDAAGLTVVRSADAQPAAVIQGWGPQVDWPQLAEATIALRAGATWVATNLDRTLPSSRGPLPGNGSLVAALREATGLEPDLVVGKPQPPLFEAAAQAAGRTPLFVGDRLDTDIAGAHGAGLPSLLVLSGVAGPRDLLAALPQQRPSYLGRDLSAVLHVHQPVHLDGDVARCGQIALRTDGAVLADRVAPASSGGDGLDGLRAACALAWTGWLPPDKYDACLRSLDLD